MGANVAPFLCRKSAWPEIFWSTDTIGFLHTERENRLLFAAFPAFRQINQPRCIFASWKVAHRCVIRPKAYTPQDTLSRHPKRCVRCKECLLGSWHAGGPSPDDEMGGREQLPLERTCAKRTPIWEVIKTADLRQTFFRSCGQNCAHSLRDLLIDARLIEQRDLEAIKNSACQERRNR